MIASTIFTYSSYIPPLNRLLAVSEAKGMSTIVYRIFCKNCDLEYVGQTKRSFAVRLKEHQQAVLTGEHERSVLTHHGNWPKEKFIKHTDTAAPAVH